MERWIGTVAVVTGGTAGIGAGICKRLVKEGLKVVSLSRNVSVENTSSNSSNNQPGRLYSIECDVTNLEQVEKSFEWIFENIGVVQILINNAGLIKFGSFLDGDPREWKEVFDVNVMGGLNCTRQVLGKLKETNLEGHIIHMNSVSGHYCVVGTGKLRTNVKSASKRAVTCLNDCMRIELLQHKLHIKVTNLSPGFVKTDNEPDSYREQTKNMPKLEVEDVVNSVIFILGSPLNTHVQELIIRPFGEEF